MKRYSLKLTLKKALVSLVQLLIAGALAYFTGEPIFFGLIPLAEGYRNYLKHN